jgi:hypothetical protein
MILSSLLTTVVLAAGVVTAPRAATAGIYYEQTTVVSKDGRSQGPGISARVWFSGRRVRLEAGDPLKATPFILRLDEGRAWRLDPARKLALELDPEGLRASAQRDFTTAAQLMGADEEGRVRTTRLAQRRTIAGHLCSGYRIKSPSATLEVYLAQDLPLGVDAFAEYLEWTGAGAALGELLTELRKLPGFPLETRARVRVLGEVQETLSTVTRVRLGAHPEALFAPPRGYEVVRDRDDEEE